MAPDDQELRVAAPTQEGLRRSTAFGDFGDGHVGILVPPSGEAFREDGLLCGGDRVGGDGAVEGADAGRNPGCHEWTAMTEDPTSEANSNAWPTAAVLHSLSSTPTTTALEHRVSARSAPYREHAAGLVGELQMPCR